MATAVFVLFAYLGLCWLCWYRYRCQQPSAEDASPTGECLVVYASQTGYAASLAEQTARALGLSSPLQMHQVTPERLQRASRALFVVSTCGEGEAPDMAHSFVRRFLHRGESMLTHLEYAVLALGDRQYSRFCQFGRDLFQGLQHRGAQPLFAPIEVDGRDHSALERWQNQLQEVVVDPLSSVPTPVKRRSIGTEQPEYFGAVLRQRECLNPGSPGDPLYRVTLDPTELPPWQAGDILTVAVPTGASGVGALVERDYSIASIADEGELQLLVRQVRATGQNTPQTLGLGSGWLTHRAPVSVPVLCRLRSNPAFHSPPPAADVILIGAGTGLAGLRGHLAGRAYQAELSTDGLGRSWLLLGERSPQRDALLVEELHRWQSSGVLARVDLAFSRCLRRPRYVQQLLEEQGERLRSWVADGAYLYVCGSRSGMGESVDTQLNTLLGQDEVERLLAEGRYRRDLY